MAELTSPLPMSTTDSHILTEVDVGVAQKPSSSSLSDDEFIVKYEIERTLEEIRRNKWQRLALQFPDEMLKDSARVYQMLSRGSRQAVVKNDLSVIHKGQTNDDRNEVDMLNPQLSNLTMAKAPTTYTDLKLTILADTSYGSCCVDEIAAEHVDAEAVIHYGRTCFSPTARLPVVYIYTRHILNHEDAIQSFVHTFPDRSERVIVMTDAPYQHHIDDIRGQLRNTLGYQNVFAADISKNNGGIIPNRLLPPDIAAEQDEEKARESLKQWSIFHVADPPTALLLTLESRLKAVHIYNAEVRSDPSRSSASRVNSAQTLRRRYALVTSLSKVSTWGILINTLSVKNYLHIVDFVKRQILDAGKKSYLFVVGKLNPAKVANFSEIGGWVVIGCWESSLVDSRGFYRPLVTPFELELVLQSDSERVWTGEWRGDFQGVLDKAAQRADSTKESTELKMPGAFMIDEDDNSNGEDQTLDSDEDEPPEFDLRTGKYVARTRPMRPAGNRNVNRVVGAAASSQALAKRATGDIISVNGIASPAAQFLAEQRTWRGLGSDFEVKDDDEEEKGGLIQEGHTGVARGYTIGNSSQM